MTDGVNTAIRDLSPFSIQGSESALIARASRDVISPPHAQIILDGSASYATDGASLRYRWTNTFRPPGSDNIARQESETARATVTLNELGSYVFRLEVTDTNGRMSIANKSVFVQGDLHQVPHAALEIRQLTDGKSELRWPQVLEAYPQNATELETGDWARLVAPSETQDGLHTLTLTHTISRNSSDYSQTPNSSSTPKSNIADIYETPAFPHHRHSTHPSACLLGANIRIIG